MINISPAAAYQGDYLEAESIKEQYTEIVSSIKDDPHGAIKDLKKIIGKNNSAAIEYLILLSIYQPEKVNTQEFDEIAKDIHTKIISQYEKVTIDQPFYKIYQDIYFDLVKDDYTKCYKDLQCLIMVGSYVFSKSFDIWDNVSR